MSFLSRLFGGPKIQPTAVRTRAQFEELVLGSPIPVVVDVWSPTCVPCRKLVPVMVEVATRHEGRVRVVEIDAASTEPALLGMLRVKATPTIILYEEGGEIGRTTGYKPPSWFHEMVEVEFPAEA